MEKEFSGNFYVIEGPDASGKETQAERLTRWFRENNAASIRKEDEERIIGKMPGKYPDNSLEKVEDSIKNGVWRLSFPTYGQTPGGRLVESYLNGELGKRKELPLQRKIDVFAADRKQFRLLIQEFLDSGGVIVCDRYREANLVHQLVGVEDWEKKLEEIKEVDEDLPDPDTVFYLNISPEEALRRMDSKEKDIHELDDEYMRKSNMNGRKVAEHEDWEIIDAEASRSEVEKRLKQSILDA